MVLLLVALVEVRKEATVCTTLLSASSRTLLFHTMYGIRNVERFLERCETRRTCLTNTSAYICEKRRVECTWTGRQRCWQRWRRWCSGDPRVCEEFVDGVALSRVNAKEMSDKILS